MKQLTKDFIINEATLIFNILNGELNVINILSKLVFKFNSNSPLMAVMNINEIHIHVDTIINKFNKMDQDMFIKSGVLIDVISHELAHADQSIDYNLYSINEDYKMQIEHQANFVASKYIIDNYNTIIKHLYLSENRFEPFFIEKFISINNIALNNLTTRYTHTTLKELYFKSISYRFKDVTQLKFDDYNNIVISISDGVRGMNLYIKYNGNYVVNTYLFNKHIIENSKPENHAILNATETKSTLSKTLKLNIKISNFIDTETIHKRVV